jgi:hypothetical protein
MHVLMWEKKSVLQPYPNSNDNFNTSAVTEESIVTTYIYMK